jgi:hypothetical protein
MVVGQCVFVALVANVFIVVGIAAGLVKADFGNGHIRSLAQAAGASIAIPAALEYAPRYWCMLLQWQQHCTQHVTREKRSCMQAELLVAVKFNTVPLVLSDAAVALLCHVVLFSRRV